jgi:hypothetical protein
LLRAMKTGLDVSRESSYDSNPNQRSLNMHEPNEDVAGYIAARVLGEDSETPPQQPLHTMSLRLPYEMAAYLIELAGTTDTSRVEMARQLVQAGIDAVLSRLPAEVAYDIRTAAQERLQDMLSEL